MVPYRVLILFLVATVTLTDHTAAHNLELVDDDDIVIEHDDDMRASQDAAQTRAFDKLNAYLERKIEPEASLAKTMDVMRSYSKKSINRVMGKLRSDQFPMKEIRKVIELYDTAMRPDCQHYELDSWKAIDQSLDDRVIDEPLRVDRLLTQIAFEYVFRCQDLIFNVRPQFDLLFSRKVYAKLEEDIKSRVGDSIDILSIGKALDLLRAAKSVGSSNNLEVDAVDQIKSLAKIAEDPSYCSEQGFDVLLKNYLATGYKYVETDDDMGSGLITTFVSHYIREHASMCRAHYTKEFREQINGISDEDKRLVLAMTNEISFDFPEGKRLSVATVDIPIDIEAFTTPELSRDMVEWQDKQQTKIIDTASRTESRYVGSTFLLNWIKWASNESSERVWLKEDKSLSQFDKTDSDERREHIDGLVVKYALSPCRNYISKVGPSVFQLLEQPIANVPDKFTKMRKDYFLHNLDFIIGRRAFVVCRELVNRSGEWASSLNKFYL